MNAQENSSDKREEWDDEQRLLQDGQTQDIHDLIFIANRYTLAF